MSWSPWNNSRFPELTSRCRPRVPERIRLMRRIRSDEEKAPLQGENIHDDLSVAAQSFACQRILGRIHVRSHRAAVRRKIGGLSAHGLASGRRTRANGFAISGSRRGSAAGACVFADRRCCSVAGRARNDHGCGRTCARASFAAGFADDRTAR